MIKYKEMIKFLSINSYLALGILLMLAFFSCSEDPILIPPDLPDPDVMINPDPEPDPEPEPDPFNNIIEYEESFEDFANPERGFYKYSDTYASNYRPLSLAQLTSYREDLRGGSGSAYRTYKTLVFRYFIMDSFVDSDISQEFLDNVNADFEMARQAGVKLIPRFCYTVTANSGDCPEGFICPPYGDASKPVVLRHINQLSAVINDNVDVINCIQMGFIGTWGENYYTDHFGDASSNGGVGKVLDENWEDRLEVLQAMLDNWDEEIMIQVRYVQLKQRAIHGINAPTSTTPMTIEEAFNGSDISRLAYHNDCLFASADDFGTFADYGNSSTERRSANTVLRSYFYDDSQYVIVGGETCSDGYSPQNNCAPDGMAEEILRRSHYTFLNIDYNNNVNNDWVDGGCIESIILNLGYRYVLREGTYEKELSDDGIFDMNIKLENVGYAPVLKERSPYLVFRNMADDTEYRYLIDQDLRTWSGEVEIELALSLNNDLPAGDYQLFIFIPDRQASIMDRPEYAIRLGNPNVWEQSNGYNNLGTVLKVN